MSSDRDPESASTQRSSEFRGSSPSSPDRARELRHNRPVMRLDLQRRHEDYWAMQWAIPLGQYLNAQIRWSRPDEDPPDAHFHARRHDGTEVMVWGEITGVYLDEEAKWLWDDEHKRVGGFWCEPDAVLGIKAREQVERKRKKYLELAQQRGPGHLLVLLLSRLTTRNTRVEVESRLRELLESAPGLDSDPFETMWLGVSPTVHDRRTGRSTACVSRPSRCGAVQFHQAYLDCAKPEKRNHPDARRRHLNGTRLRYSRGTAAVGWTSQCPRVSAVARPCHARSR